jgi:CubicO group peptidase (beta-lactamase class C family)
MSNNKTECSPMALVAAGLLLTALAVTAADWAPYSGLKPDEFMQRWLILKSIPVTEQAAPDEVAQAPQRRAFAVDWLKEAGGEAKIQPQPGLKLRIAGRDLEWKPVETAGETVDLAKGSEPSTFAIAYAWAEIEMPEPTRGVLGVGSDDAVKVWLNGKLIHENWTTRGLQRDDDLVPVEFAKGKNQLLLKVQNLEGEWGFECRLLSKQTQAQKLVTAIWQGADLESVRALLVPGIDLDARAKRGLTPYQAARLRGQRDVAELLARKGANTNADMPAPEKVADALFRDAVRADGSAVTVLVAQNGKVLFKQAYGMADREHYVAATPETKFRIGSITKQFTASAILKLQEAGKLSVADKLTKYLPDFPRGDEVTLHHLLTHTSGIRSYTDKPGFMAGVTNAVKAEDLIKSFKHDPYDFAPGEKWHYDNSGYFLLGYIIAKVSGKSYEDYLRQEFFEPLGMSNTGVYHNDAPPEHEALGYAYEDGKFSRALNWDMSWAGGAGALYSTVEDLYKWNEAVFSGKVLSAASLKAAFTPVVTKQNRDENHDSGYGYGWVAAQMRGAREISHGGGLQGFSTFLMRLPERNFTVTVLANALPGVAGAEPGQLAHTVTELYLGDKLDPRLTQQPNPYVSAKTFDALIGRYDYGMAVMTVTKEGSRFFAQLGGQPRFEIFPKSESEFFWKVVDAQVTFVKDETGKATKAIHHQGGQTITAPRLEDLKAAKVDSAAYEACLGKYDYGQGKAIMTVSREGDHLFAQLTGQPKLEIFPKSSTEFFWKVVDAQMTFVKDASGKVTKAIHHQGGQTLEAPRID